MLGGPQHPLSLPHWCPQHAAMACWGCEWRAVEQPAAGSGMLWEKIAPLIFVQAWPSQFTIDMQTQLGHGQNAIAMLFRIHISHRRSHANSGETDYKTEGIPTLMYFRNSSVVAA